jgi:hypothetical protein
MKSAIFSWAVVAFLLLGGLIVPSFQLENYAQIFAEDFAAFDGQDDLMNSSTIRRFRASGYRISLADARTATGSDILFRFAFPYSSNPLATLRSKQNLHSFNVVLRI